MVIPKNSIRTALLIGVAVSGFAMPARAQGASVAASRTGDADGQQVDEIVVTALKGNATVQDTPATVQVIQPIQIAERSVLSLNDLPKLVPALQIAPSPLGNTAIILYGLGTPSAGIAFDQSVLPLVDGAPNSHSRAFQTSLFDIENVQIIKGVQAAVLGKNSSIGAVAIMTRKPGRELAYNASVSHEFVLGSTVFDTGVTVPLNDQVSVRAAGRLLRNGGWVRNDLVDENGPVLNSKAFRGGLSWHPDDQFEYVLSGEYVSQRGDGTVFENYLDRTGSGAARCVAAGAPCEFVIDRHTQQSDLTTWGGVNNRDRLHTSRFIGTGTYDFGPVTLTSITSLQALDNETIVDSDRLPGGFFTPRFTERNRVFTQEVRLSSNGDDALQYLVGAFFGRDSWSNESLAQWNTINGSAITTGATQMYHRQVTHDYSAFAQVSFAPVEALRLTGGLRYNHMDKVATPFNTTLVAGTYSTVTNPPFPRQRFEKSEDNLDYSVAAQFDITPDIMIYASYGKGTKSGGFATGGKYLGAYNPSTTPAAIRSSVVYRPEVAHIAEAGAKFNFRSKGHLYLSAYNVEVADAQLSLSTGGTILYISRDLTSRGVNAEGAFNPTSWLTLYENVTYNWGRDRTVNGPLIYNPRWSGTVGADTFGSVGGGWRLTAGAFLDFRSDLYNRQPGQPGDIGVTFGAVQRLGAQLKLSNSNGWDIALVGENLTDKMVITSASAANGFSGINVSTDRPRTVMLRLSFSH